VAYCFHRDPGHVSATVGQIETGDAMNANTELLFLGIWGVIFVSGVGLAIYLAYIPGEIARKRGHQSAKAIGICGGLGLLIWPLWIVALIWAYTGPDRRDSPPRPAARPATRGLTCDSCGQRMVIAEARQIGPRLICPTCAGALDSARFAPKSEQRFDPPDM
jgi:hypothetical protein